MNESGWVIEKNDSGGTRYLTVRDKTSLSWSQVNDNLAAIRFCRREDAEMVQQIVDEDSIVCEHMWCCET